MDAARNLPFVGINITKNARDKKEGEVLGVQPCFPGTTIETSDLQKGSSRVLFDGIFATGGITLSQVSVMTGLEPYLIQNWVKRGFVTSPQNRVYSCDQFARIIIINMLRDSLQIEKICNLIRVICGPTDSKADDLISDVELYHRYVDMISDSTINFNDEESVIEASVKAADGFVENRDGEKKQLEKILQVMLYAYAATKLRSRSESILSTLF